MNDLDRDIIAEARRAHEHIYRKLIELKQLHGREVNLNEMVDSVYALKDAQAALEDIGKEIRAALGLIEKMSCVMYAQKGDFEPIRTEFCTGSPDIKKTVQVPKRDTPEYAALCKHFNIDPASPFKPHWPSMIKQITEDMKAGKPVPPGCDPNKMITEYKIVIRHKKPVGPGGEVSDPELLKKQYKLIADVIEDDEGLAAELLALRQEQEKRNALGEEKTLVVLDEAEDVPF